MMIDSPLPKFDELAMVEELNLRHCWGLFGDEDNLGSVNKITEQARLEAFGSALTGQVVNLSLPLDEPQPAFYGRQTYEHVVFSRARNSNDDYLSRLYLQSSTQWDGLRHIRCREFGFYGGATELASDNSDDLSISHWARRGIIGRGALIDVPRFASRNGIDYDPFSGEPVSVDMMTHAAEDQGLTLRQGDILCVSFGWVDRYYSLAAEERGEAPGRSTYAGLEGSEDMARYLWDTHVSALACDNPGAENSPGDARVGSLHRRVIPMFGLAVGELFDFRELTKVCADRQRWDFLFVSVPLNLPGGVGSPANAVGVV